MREAVRLVVLVIVWGVLLTALLPNGVSAQKLCPDGTYVAGDPVYGTCVLAPDGKYVAGPPQKRGAGGVSGGFREGVERARQRREADEERQLRMERERLEIERLRRELNAAPAPDAARPPESSSR